MYIILYSAIDQQSPTMAIIHFLNRQGENGSDIETLIYQVCPANEINVRLQLMEDGGWIISYGHGWKLTNKGLLIAKLFENTAGIFGLKNGG